MFTIGLIYLIIIFCCYLLLTMINRSKVLKSLKASVLSLINLLPILLAVFGMIGLFQEFIPPELVSRYLGESSGIFSLLICTVIGAVSIGPPVAAYPLAESLLQAGAWPPAIAAFILSWITIGIITLPYEARAFGSRFALIRNGISLLIAMISGLFLGTFL